MELKENTKLLKILKLYRILLIGIAEIPNAFSQGNAVLISSDQLSENRNTSYYLLKIETNINKK
jgi:hypothetical protein